MPWITLSLLSVVLVISAAADVRAGKVPNAITVPAMAAGLVLGAVRGGIDSGGAAGASAGLAWAMIGLLAALIPFSLIFFAGGLGGGDVKLMAAVGAITARWECVLATSVYAFVLAALMSLVVIFRRGLLRQTAHRLLGVMIGVGAGLKSEPPADSPRIPMAVAIAVGGLLAGLEVLIGLKTPWAAFV